MLYWILTQVFKLFELHPILADSNPLFFEDVDLTMMWPVVLIIMVLSVLTELGASAYCMYKTWKLPRIIKEDEDGRYYKIQGGKEKPASKPEALAYANMVIIRKELNFPDNLETALFIEEAENLNAYTLGMEMTTGGKHAICLSSNLVETMPTAGVAAVIAHEMGHINNQDVATKLFMGCFRSFVSFILFAPVYLLYLIIVVLSWIFSAIPLLGIFAGLCLFMFRQLIGVLRFLEALVMWPAHLYERYVARRSEFQADAVAAKCIGPLSICRVFYMLSRHTSRRENNPLFDFMEKLKISNSTHPSFEDRIQAVQKRIYQ